jgi:hypothetical protein
MKPGEKEGESPGLPGLHTWKRVYIFVIGSFLLWLGLLVLLEKLFP